MSRSRAFNETPEQAIRRIHHEHADDSFTVQTVQDVSEVVKNNKMNFDERHGERFNEFATHVARIPTGIYYDLMRRGIIDEKNDPEGVRLKAWLNDPDNKAWRSRPGRI